MKRTLRLPDTGSPPAAVPADDISRLTALIAAVAFDVAELRRQTGCRPVERPPDDGEWIGLKEAGARSGFAPETIRLWALAGHVRAHQAGARRLVESASVLSYAARRRAARR